MIDKVRVKLSWRWDKGLLCGEYGLILIIFAKGSVNHSVSWLPKQSMQILLFPWHLLLLVMWCAAGWFLPSRIFQFLHYYSFTVDLMNSSIIISENIFVIQEYTTYKPKGGRGWRRKGFLLGIDRVVYYIVDIFLLSSFYSCLAMLCQT